ncbi:MAG TPA: hypothetical protein VK589_26905 [Chryseolinea sp.]|nr:hypothetical protein [Chryseolinea sp.]
MNFLTFWVLIVVVVIILLAGTLFLGYWIPKKLGYKKPGIVLSGILAAGLILSIIATISKDYLFFKSDAKEFLSKHDIHLNDDFRIIHNDSDEILGAFQKFSLEISPTDKLRIIESITSSVNFGKDDFIEQENNSRTTINYEDNKSFIRKSRQAFGRNEVPIIEIVQVNKGINTLTCYKYIP